MLFVTIDGDAGCESLHVITNLCFVLPTGSNGLKLGRLLWSGFVQCEQSDFAGRAGCYCAWLQNGLFRHWLHSPQNWGLAPLKAILFEHWSCTQCAVHWLPQVDQTGLWLISLVLIPWTCVLSFAGCLSSDSNRRWYSYTISGLQGGGLD